MINFTADKRVLSLVQDPATSAKPPVQCVSVAIFQGIKRQGREADHLPPSSALNKNLFMDTSYSPYTLMALTRKTYFLHLALELN